MQHYTNSHGKAIRAIVYFFLRLYRVGIPFLRKQTGAEIYAEVCGKKMAGEKKDRKFWKLRLEAAGSYLGITAIPCLMA